MAHAYTTARGKTKKAKETQRKDAKNNAANKLMTNIAKAPTRAQTYIPKNFLNKSSEVNGMKTLEGATKAKLFQDHGVNDETIATAIRNVRVQLPTYQRCFYSLCASPSDATAYKHCGRCRIARYCSPECQKADWSRIHKVACGKPELLSVGCSVAIRPLDSHLSSLPSTLYPTESCRAPCNEIHGIVIALQPTPTDPPTPPTSVEVEIFDSNVIPTSSRLTVAVGDVVVSGWALETERNLAEQKSRDIEESRKRAEERKAMIEEEERVHKEKQLKKAQRVQELVEKKKREMEKASGSVGVDWSLFESELMESLDEEDAE